ncbi:hypothetical protein CCYA_CCYA02G0776 [Cyanidiococcus yangmingshanensis]|nr:hypothetical protein CCYA_CCYA02G0776 [Cyanidiococcus yangmingshanensis]
MQSPLQRVGTPQTLPYDQQRIYTLRAELLRYKSAYKRLREYVLRINSLLEQREVALASFPRVKLAFRSFEEQVGCFSTSNKENLNKTALNHLVLCASPLEKGSDSADSGDGMPLSPRKSSELTRYPDSRSPERNAFTEDVDDSRSAGQVREVDCLGLEMYAAAADIHTQVRTEAPQTEPQKPSSPEPSEARFVDFPRNDPGATGSLDTAKDASQTDGDVSASKPNSPMPKATTEATEGVLPAPFPSASRMQRRRRRRRPLSLVSAPNIWTHKEPLEKESESATSEPMPAGWACMPRLLKETFFQITHEWDLSRARILALCGVSFGAGFISAALTIGHIETNASNTKRSTCS